MTTSTIKIPFKTGSTEQNDAYLGQAGEITIDRTKRSLRVHDGIRRGGEEILRRSDLDEVRNLSIEVQALLEPALVAIDQLEVLVPQATTASASAIAARDLALSYRDLTLTYKNSAETARNLALAYRDTALTYRDAALTYKNSAETAAGTATTKAGEASTSATAALASKTSAETAATTSTTKAAESLASATKASQWATSLTAVETGKYGALYYSNLASTSATTATTKAGEASTSATAALSSKTSAETAAGTATTKAAEAVTSAGTALTQANRAQGYADQMASGQVNADWSATSGAALILNKPDISAMIAANALPASGTTAQFLRGDKTWQDFSTPVRTTTLTGLSTGTNSSVTATDTLLVGVGKLQAQMNSRASLASPNLTGVPLTTSPAAGANTQQIAPASWVKTEIATAINSLVSSAPGTLDTLNELALALGNDPNFATTITNTLASKADLSALTNVENKSSATIRSELTKLNVTNGLGYEPLQHGTGPNQFPNSKVKIGWLTGSRLGLAVDDSDFASTWPININGSASSLNGQTAAYYLALANQTGTLPLTKGGTGATTAAAARTALGLDSVIITGRQVETNLDTISGNKFFGFTGGGATPTTVGAPANPAGAYDAAGMQLDQAGHRSQLAFTGADLMIRTDDTADGTIGWAGWRTVWDNTNLTSLSQLTNDINGDVTRDWSAKNLTASGNILANGVNYLNMAGGNTNVAPAIVASGADTNVGMYFGVKGSGEYNFTASGKSQFRIATNVNAVNNALVYGGSAGANPTFGVQGTDTNIGMDFTAKGAGEYVFRSNSGIHFVIRGANAAVNYLSTYGALTGGRPTLEAQGSDANIGIAINGKGTGGVILATGGRTSFAAEGIANSVNYLQATPTVAGQAAILKAQGTDTHIGIVIQPKGTSGKVLVDAPLELYPRAGVTERRFTFTTTNNVHYFYARDSDGVIGLYDLTNNISPWFYTPLTKILSIGIGGCTAVTSTASAGDNTDRLASTAFVQGALQNRPRINGGSFAVPAYNLAAGTTYNAQIGVFTAVTLQVTGAATINVTGDGNSNGVDNGNGGGSLILGVTGAGLYPVTWTNGARAVNWIKSDGSGNSVTNFNDAGYTLKTTEMDIFIFFKIGTNLFGKVMR